MTEQDRLNRLLTIIEGLEGFRGKYRNALSRFLQGDRVPLTMSEIGSPKRPHCRSTLRCIQATAVLKEGRDWPALAKDSIKQVVSEAWEDPSKTAFGALNFYTTSNMLYLAVVCDSPLATDLRRMVDHQLEEEFRKSRPNAYLVLFAENALHTVRQSEEVSRVALAVLYDQLVFHSARLALDFDSAQLATAAVLLSRAEPADVGLSEAQHKQVIRRAAEIILRSDGLEATMRVPRPQYGERNAVIHTVPFEDMLIISQLPLSYMPLEMPAVEDMVRSLERQFVEFPSGDAGWTLESDVAFPKPMSWTTAIYCEMLERSRRLLRFCFTEGFLRLIEEVDRSRVERFASGRIDENVTDWVEVLETEEQSKELIERFILGGQDTTTEPAAKSLLVFGPPGTSKTTLVKGVASQLVRDKMSTREGERWPLLMVNPADLLGEGGYSALVGNLQQLFRQIRRLSEVVVFFDEAENLVFGRSIVGESREDRMVTVSMLPLLNNIEHEDILFVMATNYVREIDHAVRRRGRFALRVGIGTPDLVSRMKLIGKRLSKTVAGNPDIADLIGGGTAGLTVREVAAVCDEIASKGGKVDGSEVKLVLRRAKQRAELTTKMRRDFVDDLKTYHDGEHVPSE